MNDDAIAFLHERQVDATAECEAAKLELGPCTNHAMMWVRVDAVELMLCYHHVSILYNKAYGFTDSRERRARGGDPPSSRRRRKPS
jgi:hypothetical protein